MAKKIQLARQVLPLWVGVLDSSSDRLVVVAASSQPAKVALMEKLGLSTEPRI
jgi:hypothetical protein